MGLMVQGIINDMSLYSETFKVQKELDPKIVWKQYSSS